MDMPLTEENAPVLMDGKAALTDLLTAEADAAAVAE